MQNTTTFGANIISFYNPVEKMSILLEFVQFRVSTKTESLSVNTTNKYWDSALFVGVGFNITNKISIGAKYNLLCEKGESVYTSPVIPFVNIIF